MKKYKKILLEIALVLLAALLYGIYDYWRTAKPTHPTVTAILSVLAAIDIILLFFVMRALFRNEAHSALGRKLRAMLERIGALVKRLAKKYLPFGRNDNVVTGVTSVSFDYTLFKKRKEKPEKYVPPRWRDMKSAREKLGFVYYRMISRKIKKGNSIYAHETPSEIKSRLVNSAAESELFELYINARYDESIPLSEEEVLELKDKIK